VLALRENEDHYRDLVENSLDLICTHDLNGVLLTVNLAAARTLGYEPSELVNRNVREFLSPKSHEEFDAFLSVMREKWAASGFLRVRTKNGETRIWRYTSTLRVEGVQVPFVRGVAHDLTDILQAQKALRKSEERLRVAAEVGRMYAWEWDPATDTVLRSAECAGILGLDGATGDGVAKDYFSLVHPDDRARLWGLATSLTPTNPEYRTEYRRFRPDGALLWLQECGHATFDKAGKMIRLVGMTADITERKRAEDERFRHAAIVESSDDAIISKDLNGIIQSWNAGAQRLFGFTESEAAGRPVTILIPPELLDEEKNILQQLRTSERIEHYETIRVTKGGKKLNVSLTISPIKDSSGRIVGISKIARDITDRKRTEQTLRESEERFRLVANKAPVLIWMSGTDKLCTFFNQCWLDFSGRSMEQELGDGWASGVHPEDRARCHETYASAFDARVDFEMEYRLKRFDGKYRWVVDHGVPRFESDGVFCGYIGSCVDITDRKLAAESLEELSGRLITAQDEERTRIARELHDDFSQRLALQGIGLAQLWKKIPESEVEVRAKVQELLKGIQEMSSDMHSLSHQLHSSKLEHVGLVPALMGLCKELSSRFKIQIEFTDHAISSGIPKDVALCLFRIAQEALNNVVKHSGAKQAQAELSCTKNEIRLRIVDAGFGFDPALRNGDAGLGLVSMRERLRLVRGRLSVQSAPMRGTEILAEVPVSASTSRPHVRVMTVGGKKS
jgi:PAS domain S-box-containing protein